ncbi:MAG TPA: hypothetical protein DCE56_02485 [Cyanobacteria bacterium UBA8553]|nr:hypothetical protein [Cyanobacteria bacterium UBA8553]HAJ62146.1 hypothetical protein [Cyanobacteria bacterium UBA8543]
MNFDFNDPNLLIDDFIASESSDKHRTRLKAPKPLQNYLFVQTGGTEFEIVIVDAGYGNNTSFLLELEIAVANLLGSVSILPTYSRRQFIR